MRANVGTMVAPMLVVLVLSGCQGKSAGAAPVTVSPTAPASAAAPTSAAALPPSATASVAAGSSGVPRQVSALPAGVFRSHIGYSLITKMGGDPALAGTWTLTVKDGTYRIDCAPISQPDTDCGHNGSKSLATVELGTVRGTGSTVWFVHDVAALHKLTGCVVGSLEAGDCGPDGGYRARWALNGQSLVFTDYVGLGDEAGEPALEQHTIQPWTRIS